MSEQNITIIIIGWVITGIIAIIGWIFVAVQARKNRNQQKAIEQKKMRHDAYRSFLKEIDAISKEMSISPMNTIQEIAKNIYQKYLQLIFNLLIMKPFLMNA